MRYAWTFVALAMALLLQSALGVLSPGESRVVDPFLIVVVYCGLTGGETHGMLAGAAAGWIEDIHFGGPIMGFSALAKLLVGFLVGAAGSRFLIAGTAPRSLTLFAATLVDAFVFERLVVVFEVPASRLSVFALMTRATITALSGALAFWAADWQRRRRELRS